MNKKASFLGMNNTTFNNPHGLDEKTKNYSTAYDMALLSQYANRIPLYREISSTKYYDVKTNIKSYSWINRDKLVFTYPYFVSGKTGYTPMAGKTFVSSAKKNNLELTIVSLNDSDHYNNHINLYNKMFDTYQNYLLISKETFNKEHKNLYIKNDIYYPLTKEEFDKINIKLLINDKDVNSLIITMDGNEIYREKVYKNDKKESIYDSPSFWNKIKKIFDKIF